MTEDIKARALALIAECEQPWTEFANKDELAQITDTVRGLLAEIARLEAEVLILRADVDRLSTRVFTMRDNP